jgi:hypothetical protein
MVGAAATSVVGSGSRAAFDALAPSSRSDRRAAVRDKRAERNEARARDEHNTKVENGDESVDEGKLRVAVRRSVEDPEVAARRRQEHLDAAAVRRGEETRRSRRSDAK